MKYYIIAGEASGDMHAANMMKELKKLDDQAYFRVWGGDRMAEQAQELAKHVRETSFMGIFQVVTNLRTIKRNFRFCEEDITQFQPDVLILIDNSGFNLRIAKYVKDQGLKTKVFYYILPQAWAWKKKRVHTIHQWTDAIYSILPFEKAFYKSYGYDIEFVGHPILDSIEQRATNLMSRSEFLQKHSIADKPLIAILPGSRKQEIIGNLSRMMKVIPHFPDYEFIIAGSETIDTSLYQQYTQGKVKIAFGATYDILNNAQAALVTSGTATLETALFNVPQVVCYKAGFFTFHILKRIVSIKYICMVNLILDKMAVQELIESDLNENRLVRELMLVLNGQKREQVLADYQTLREKLGGTGASQNVAKLMINELKDIQQNH